MESRIIKTIIIKFPASERKSPDEKENTSHQVHIHT